MVVCKMPVVFFGNARRPRCRCPRCCNGCGSRLLSSRCVSMSSVLGRQPRPRPETWVTCAPLGNRPPLPPPGFYIKKVNRCNFSFAGDITQKGYEKKRTKLLAPYAPKQNQGRSRLNQMFPLSCGMQRKREERVARRRKIFSLRHLYIYKKKKKHNKPANLDAQFFRIFS